MQKRIILDTFEQAQDLLVNGITRPCTTTAESKNDILSLFPCLSLWPGCGLVWVWVCVWCVFGGVCVARCVNSHISHTACTDAHTLSAHHIALIPCTTSVAQSQPDCVLKIVVSFHLSRAMSLAPHRTPSTSSSTFHQFQVSKSCSHPEILAQIHGSAGVTDRYTDPEPLNRL